MIYCVWYPSGGFGHYISHLLNVYGQNFARPTNTNFEFGKNGNSHSIELVAKRYHGDPETYSFAFDATLNYAVLVDNGINNEGERFRKFFPSAKIIKIAYTDVSWPIVANTMIHKVIRNSLEKELPLDNRWACNQSWAQREKYFLFLRDHPLRLAWKPTTTDSNLLVDDLLDYNQLYSKFAQFGISMENFYGSWIEWKKINSVYFDPVMEAKQIISDVKSDVPRNLEHIKDLWSQAVVYYFLWLEFEKEVPHNDFKNFFNDTSDIKNWLKL